MTEIYPNKEKTLSFNENAAICWNIAIFSKANFSKNKLISEASLVNSDLEKYQNLRQSTDIENLCTLLSFSFLGSLPFCPSTPR